MDYVNLGRTGVKVSPLCLGTMNFGPRTPEAESIKLIHQSLDSGINFIDTANFYGQPLNDGRGQGITESIVGNALEGRRDRVVLATKVRFQTADYPDDPNSYGLSRRHIIAECENSLRRLNTDYIDLYQLHRPHYPIIPIDETLRALDDLVRSGKVRYIGTSEFPAWQFMQALWQSDKLNAHRFVSEQPFYNPLIRRAEREIFPMALEYGVALIPWSPLHGGFLAGKYTREQLQNLNDVEDSARFKYDDYGWDMWKLNLNERTWQLLDELHTIAQEKDCTVSQVTLAWILKQEAITSIIIGPRTQAHLEDNVGALNVEITEEDQARIDAISPPKVGLVEF